MKGNVDQNKDKFFKQRSIRAKKVAPRLDGKKNFERKKI
jgi:hypothetical protein